MWPLELETKRYVITFQEEQNRFETLGVTVLDCETFFSHSFYDRTGVAYRRSPSYLKAVPLSKFGAFPDHRSTGPIEDYP